MNAKTYCFYFLGFCSGLAFFFSNNIVWRTTVWLGSHFLQSTLHYLFKNCYIIEKQVNNLEFNYLVIIPWGRNKIQKNNASSDHVNAGISGEKTFYCVNKLRTSFQNPGSFKKAMFLCSLLPCSSMKNLNPCKPIFVQNDFSLLLLFFFFFNWMNPVVPWDLSQITALAVPLMLSWLTSSLLFLLCFGVQAYCRKCSATVRLRNI